jgi:hypothetical protein
LFNREHEVEFSFWQFEEWSGRVKLRCTTKSGKSEDIELHSFLSIQKMFSVAYLNSEKTLLLQGRSSASHEGATKKTRVLRRCPEVESCALNWMSDLDDIQVGDWLMIVSTMKGSSFILQQVTSTTSGLVRTLNYTFRRDGRSFSLKQKSLTARLAQSHEIEGWLSGRKKQDPTPKSLRRQAAEW